VHTCCSSKGCITKVDKLGDKCDFHLGFSNTATANQDRNKIYAI
jgi:hypothetical protein